MKYVKSANKEYIFDDGRNMNGIEKHKPDEGGKNGRKNSKKIQQAGLYYENYWIYRS